jgi:hypothetical protein
VIVYRLTVPIDDFEDFVPVTDWIRGGSPQDVSWILTAVLALPGPLRSLTSGV